MLIRARSIQICTFRKEEKEVIHSHDQVEIGIIDIPISHPEIDMRELCTAEIGCVMPAAHRLARARAVTSAMLSNENLITFAEDTPTGTSLRYSLRAAGKPYRIAYTTNQTVSAYSLVRSGAGIAPVDRFSRSTVRSAI